MRDSSNRPAATDTTEAPLVASAPPWLSQHLRTSPTTESAIALKTQTEAAVRIGGGRGRGRGRGGIDGDGRVEFFHFYVMQQYRQRRQAHSEIRAKKRRFPKYRFFFFSKFGNSNRSTKIVRYIFAKRHVHVEGLMDVRINWLRFEASLDERRPACVLGCLPFFLRVTCYKENVM